MTDFNTNLDAQLPARTAGSLPSTRTFGMVEDALASENIDEVKAELIHTRAHYQSLEYMLNSEARIIETILKANENAANDPEQPAPETFEETVRLIVRLYSSVITDSAYDTAHSVGFFMGVLGMDLQEALRTLYDDLDHRDPEREVTDADIATLIADFSDNDN